MLCPFAIQKSSPNHGGPIGTIIGVVEHVTAGESDPWGTFANPANQVSSHFGIGNGQGGMADGLIEQYVDTSLTAWAEAAGNAHYISVETEGVPSEALTPAQVTAFGKVYAWVHQVHGVPLVITDTPGQPGLITHGDGGAAWGGHTGCLPLDSTEVLTPQGWRSLGDVHKETLLASWSADSGLIEFASPLAIVTPYVDRTVSVAGFEMTPDHRIYVHRSDGPYRKVLTAEELGSVRTNWLIPAAGKTVASGIGIGPDLMRLLAWVQADAHYAKGKNGKIQSLDWHITKQRKVDRIQEVLAAMEWPCTARRQSNGTWRIRAYGQERIERDVLRWLPDKRWGWWLLGADRDEFDALDGEICLADGHERSDMRVYSTAIEGNADIIQALYVTHGRRASKRWTERMKPHHMDTWTVQFAISRDSFTTRDTYRDERTEALVGCVTTHNDTILVRQRGRVAIVGNCPGDLRKTQRQAILNAAGAAPAPAPGPSNSEGDTVGWTAHDDESGGFFATDHNGDLANLNGAPFIQGLNQHPDYKAGDVESGNTNPCVGIETFKDKNGHTGIAFVTRLGGVQDVSGLRFYRFARDGSPD